MRYTISYAQNHQHFIDVEMIMEAVAGKLKIQLPSWRPGRYELSNYAKNVRNWRATDSKGKALDFSKITKDLWEVDVPLNMELHILYSYYAADLDAGNSYLDDLQLFVNPANCCMYVPDKRGEAIQLNLVLPDNYQVATAMKQDKPVAYKALKNENRQKISQSVFSLKAADYDELADSPFIASQSLKHNMFIMDGIEFHLWIQGECKPDWAKIINDFFIFINEQVNMMKGCPVKEYHFLFHLMPNKCFHGVEHLGSTDISIGPTYNFMKEEMYNNFLGISCHEFFHCWNIKSIRPAEMFPYDYTKENYSRLGYVCEGVTTYYGNYLLYRSGVFNEIQYLKSVKGEVQKHFDNYGRFNLSVALSSFDTWLDGYTAGVPGRKVSIYTEGGLLAFITDMFIRKNTQNKKSLDNVMQALYHDYALQGKPYTEGDYLKIVERMATRSFAEIFETYFNKPADLLKPLIEAMNWLGMELYKSAGRKYYERFWGMKTSEDHGNGHGSVKVSAVAPDSPAAAAGIFPGDEIIIINGHQIKNNFNDWCEYYNEEEVQLTVITAQQQRNIKIAHFPGKEYYPCYHVFKKRDATLEQKAAYRHWCNRDF